MRYEEKLQALGIAETRTPGLAAAVEALNKELCKLDMDGLRKFTTNTGILGQLDMFARHSGSRNVAKEIYTLNLNAAWHRMDTEEMESTARKMMDLGTAVEEFAELNLPGARILMKSMSILIRRITNKNGLSYFNLLQKALIIDGNYRMGSEILQINKTKKYVGSCNHLDTWDTVGEFTSLYVTERGGEESYESGSALHFIRVQSDRSEKDIRAAIKDTYDQRGCSHEHDCCGCVSQYVSRVKHLGNGVWVLKTSWYRNV